MAAQATAVIITAKDAADTIGRAVTSALLQAPVTEVIVVDDGSGDATADVAKACDDDSNRLQIIRFDRNRGPSAGRNAAIDRSTAPNICILDADDFMGAGRLEKLFEIGGNDWELLADDILFATEPDESTVYDKLLPADASLPMYLSLSAFAEGNIPRGRSRRELGFLKPVIKRDLIDRLSIRYNEQLRLGEDLIFYADCMLGGGRFKVVEACGYHAIQYPNSLSARHRTHDVQALHRALLSLAKRADGQGAPSGGLNTYTRHVRDRMALRLLIDAKHEGGLASAVATLREYPASMPFMMREVARAKLAAAFGWRA